MDVRTADTTALDLDIDIIFAECLWLELYMAN